MLTQVEQAIAQLQPLIHEAELRDKAASAAEKEARAAESAMDTVIKTATFMEGETEPKTSVSVN